MIFTFVAAGFAAASQATTNIYFAHTAQGANNGADCADAYAYNDGSNGINASANWVAGNTLHLCGTITVGAGNNIVTAHGSGSSGSPITVKFEPGAILQAPYFGTGGSAGIYLSGHNYITVDGGNSGAATGGTTWTGGLIQNYANGSSGQNNCPGINNTYTGACSYQTNPTTVIEAIGSSNITIENLGPCVGAVVTGGNFSNGAPGVACIHFQGSNVTITNNQLHNDGIGIDNTYYGNDTNTVISNNDFQENGWGIGCAGAKVTNSNYQVYNNHFHNFDGWTSTGAHVNGIHCYDGSGGGISSFYLYNNVFDGKMGTCCWTAWVYLESNGPGDNWDNNTGTVYAFNNIFVDSLGIGNGNLQTGGGVNHYIVNNTFWGTQNAQYGTGKCLQWGGTGVTIENNVFIQCWQIMFADPHSGQTPSYRAIDYNIYGSANSGDPYWQVNSISQTTFSGWQNACNCDSHGQASNNTLTAALTNITSEGVPSAGFIGIQQGANLTSAATGLLSALDFDTGAGNTHTPVQRPGGTCTTQGTSSCWDIGAYQYGSGDPPPNPPTGLSAVVN
jgi:hypothetical protein